MEGEKAKAETDEHSEAKGESHQSQPQWKGIFWGAWIDFRDKHTARAVTFILGLLLGPAFGVYMSNPKFIIWGVALSVIVAVIIVAASLSKQVGPHLPIAAPITAPPPAAQPQRGDLERPAFRQKLPTDDVTINIGSNTFHVSLKALETSSVTVPLLAEALDYNPVRIYAKNRHPMIDVNLWGGIDQAAVEVKENEFVVKPDGWDSNSSPNALEIVNEHQQPVLQLFYKNPMYIVVNGVFPSPQGALYASENGVLINPTQPPLLKPIFKYPSWKYPGEYADDTKK